MRTNTVIDATIDEIESAKETALSLISDTPSNSALDLFYTDNLQEIETGIRRLNEVSNKAYILSSVLLYTLIFNNDLYTQSGLSWDAYTAEARQRLGVSQATISNQLSTARFFIRYHNALERAGWKPDDSYSKLARAELALSLCNNIDEVIEHLINDSSSEFKKWYTSIKDGKKLSVYIQDLKRDDIKIDGNRFYIKGIESVTISDDIPSEEKERIQTYITQIFEILQQGYEPAIVSAYDKREASIIPRLRDNFRMGK